MSAPVSANACLATRSFQRILIVKPSSLGDLVHALPVLHGLRTRYAQALISWLVAEPFAPLIANHPELDDVVLFDRKQYRMLGRGLTPSLAFIEFVHSLRARRFDLAIDLQGLFRSGFLTMAAGAPVRLGFAAAREMAPIFYTHRIGVDRTAIHAADRNYRVGSALGFAGVPMVFDFAITDQERQAASAILAEGGLAAGAPFLAVLPGARWETKRWAPARFASVIDRVRVDHGLGSVLLGGPAELDLCASIARDAYSTPINLAGRTGVRDVVAILERAAVVLAHDSAPMHIAAALGRPLVAILGPTHPRRTGPYGMLRSVSQADLPCVPCYLKFLSQCPYDHRCMEAVDVVDVARNVGNKLSQGVNWVGAHHM